MSDSDKIHESLIVPASECYQLFAESDQGMKPVIYCGRRMRIMQYEINLVTRSAKMDVIFDDPVVTKVSGEEHLNWHNIKTAIDSGRCECCKHWTIELSPRADMLGWWMTSAQSIGSCEIISMPPDRTALAAAACLSEGIGGNLITDARFGCVLFERNSDAA